jgi:hypothetical protein
MDVGIVGVASITVICYLAAQALKATKLNDKWIPVLCGASGLVLGIVGMFVMPDFPMHDILSSAAVGVVSGLAATGVNQIYKQLTKPTERGANDRGNT